MAGGGWLGTHLESLLGGGGWLGDPPGEFVGRRRLAGGARLRQLAVFRGQPGEHVDRLPLREALGPGAAERVLPQRPELGLMEPAGTAGGTSRYQYQVVVPSVSVSG